MGNRISISFKNGNDESVYLFSHWDGMDFKKDALKFVDELYKSINTECNGAVSNPISRLEPNTVMINFINWKFPKGLIKGNYYLGKDEEDGDNSDNGHFAIKVEEK